MKKTIIIISIILILVIVCIFIICPLIKKNQEQTIVSDCEFCTGVDLPNNIKVLKGSRSQCVPELNPIIAVNLISELTENEYKFIKNQVADKEEWGFTDKCFYMVLEENLKKHGWQGEEYEFFQKIDNSKATRFLHYSQISMYKKANGTYGLLILTGSDFFESRNIKIN
ncbi:MAG: hypothetical protein IJE01_03720 [Clostridia bacterium]|nr:hypothetical protein [Clostridia bacterium]